MRPTPRVVRIIVLGGLVGLCAIALGVLPRAHHWEEGLGLALLFELRGARPAPTQVAVVAVHPTALEALGLTPRVADVPRSLYADLVDALYAAGATAIVFDVSFSRPGSDIAHDERLAASLQRSGRAVLLDLIEQPPSPAGASVVRRLPPTPQLMAAAAAHGPFPLPKLPPLRFWWTHMGGDTLPVLAARVAGVDGASLAAAVKDEAQYIDFYGPPRTIATVGIDAVVQAASASADGKAWLHDRFAGRTVFVGYSALHPSEQDRVRDDYDTPFSRDDGLTLSGVEIAASAYANLLEQRSPRPLPLLGQWALYATAGLLLGGLCIALPAGAALIAVVAAALSYAGVATWRFSTQAQWLPMVLPLAVQAPLALLGGVLWNQLELRGERQRLNTMVEELVPRAVLDDLFARGHGAPNDEREAFGIVVMTDIAGFTTTVEGFSPARATQLLNDYFSLVFPAIERHGGSVSQINGDAMLALWFSATADLAARHAACRAALGIAEATNPTERPPGSAALPTRIGVHAGPMKIARVGASSHYEYRAVGDTANTASRIEALSKHLGTRVLVSDTVVAGTSEFLVRWLGSFRLAGKAAPLAIGELLALESEATPAQRRCCALFASALEHWRVGRCSEALAGWSALLREFPDDGPSRFYAGLAKQRMVSAPTSPWNPTVHMALK